MALEQHGAAARPSGLPKNTKPAREMRFLRACAIQCPKKPQKCQNSDHRFFHQQTETLHGLMPQLRVKAGRCPAGDHTRTTPPILPNVFRVCCPFVGRK